MKNAITYALLLTIGCAASAQNYTVVAGDTLSNIAASQLGDGGQWRDICELNRDIVDDCNVIAPGVVLQLSATDSASVKQEMSSIEEVPEKAEAPQTASLMDVSFGPENFPTFEAGKAGIVIKPSGSKVELSGAVVDASSSGRTHGAFIRLSDEFEKAASGKTIRVTLTLESDIETMARAAYSTSEVGNSGWKDVKAGPGGIVSSFLYKVPPMKNGGGEYFGILPDPLSSGQSVSVTSLMFEILSKK